MRVTLQTTLARFAGIAAVGLSLALSHAALARSEHPPIPPDWRVWPHELGDLKPDPRIRYGQLPNGMRYAIQKTNRPEGHVAIRLRFSAGSLHETDKEQGLAHYLEHMAFQGSKNLTRNEFVQKLQRLGLSFGADTNASTGFDQTLYMLNLPRNDATTVGESMAIMREVADRLTISSDAVEAEKGVILSEERVRDTPGYRAIKRLYADLFEGMKVPLRFPIGTVETIKDADAKTLRGYYERYYRPERAFLVVTGELDADSVEKQIKDLFSNWKQPGEMGPEADYGVYIFKAPRAINVVDPSFPGTVTVNWISSEPFMPPTRANAEIDLRRAMAFQMVNARLQRIAEEPNPPFAGASVGCSSSEQSDRTFARRCALTVRSGAKGLKVAIAAAEQAVRQSVDFPPSAGEIDRNVRLYRGFLQSAASAADTQGTVDTANAIVNAFANREITMHPKDYLELWEETGPKFTASDYQAEMRVAFGNEPSLVFAQTNAPFEGGESALLTAVQESRKTPVTAPPAMALAQFPYTDFGKPGAIATRSELADLGVTQIRFKNGARLNVRPSQEEKGIVRMALRIQGGLLSLPKEKKAYSSAIEWIVTQGGLGKLTADQLDDALSGDILGQDWDTGESAFTMGGTAKPETALKLAQTFTAFLTDPAYRPEALDAAKAQYARDLKTRRATAQSVLEWESSGIYNDGDPRFQYLSEAEANASTLAQVKAMVAPALKDGPLEMSVAGDITVDAAIEIASRTIGALKPRRPLRTGLLPAGTLRFPASKVVNLTHDGRADQALLEFAWPLTDIHDETRKVRASAIAHQIAETSLSLSLRDKGLTYSASGEHAPSSVVRGDGMMSLTIETKPQDLETVRTIVFETIKTLTDGTFSDDLLKRAREPMVSAREASLKSNNYWLGIMSSSQAVPENLTQVRTRVSDFKTITREEIVVAARQYFVDSKRVEIRVLPSVKP
jgi:zinc protease